MGGISVLMLIKGAQRLLLLQMDNLCLLTVGMMQMSSADVDES